MGISSKMTLTAKVAAIAAAILIGIFGIGVFETNGPKVSASASGPTASNTNGPGEGNCTACHTQFPLNSGTGSVSIAGLPATWVPGQQVSLTVTTNQAEGVAYGYQMTAIDGLGRRAGSFSVPAANPQPSQIVTGVIGGESRQYVEHTIDGILPTVFDSKSWNVTWTAPDQRVGRVGFYAAGNGANGDGTTSGDYIYASSKTSTSGSPVFDFDGDGKTDLSVFRPNGAAGAEWWYLRSSNGVNGAAQFGTSTDKITPGDFTGDGKTDMAFWRPSTGFWFVLRSEDSSFFAFPFGSDGDAPAPADYDGDGKTDAAVYRPASNTWFVSNSGGGTTITQFGSAGDKPVTADYDGDAKSDIAIYRPSLGEWWIQRSTAGLIAYQFGQTGDKPIQGDFSGDGKADVAFWRPDTGFWYILRSEDATFFAFPFGANGDVPSPGDYDGDGKVDAAVFRPTNSTWFANRSTAGVLIRQFGQAGDLPVPNAFVP